MPNLIPAKRSAMAVGPVRISFGYGGLVIRSAAMRNQSGIFDGVAI